MNPQKDIESFYPTKMLLEKSSLTDLDEELAVDESITEFVEQNEQILILYHKTLKRLSESKKEYNNSQNLDRKYKFSEYMYQLGFLNGIDFALFTIKHFIFPSITQLNNSGCDY